MWIVGVDIGQHRDATAIIGVEYAPRIIDPNLKDPRAQDAHFMRRPLKTINEYTVRLMERPDIGTDYATVIERVRQIMQSPQLLHEARLVVDLGNVGDALWEEWNRMRLSPIGIRFTSGKEVARSTQGYNVPKQDLVGRLMLVFSSRRIRFASFDAERHPEQMRLKRRMIKELSEFQLKHTPRGNPVYEAASGGYDDMVMALSMAVWFCERTYPAGIADERLVEPERKPYDPLWDDDD